MAERLKARIRSEGPLSVAAFMTEAMFHPREGYYATKDPIGAGADFITAPEVSQMFGEMLGAWAAQAWLDMGRPESVQLIELGPGKGTMMADMLRAARALPEFEQAIRVTLVEASAALKSVQAQTLGHAHAPIAWADRLEAAPAGPAIILGNEFLDCLPLRQAVKEKGAWRERVVALDGEDFVFALGGVLGPEQDLIPETLSDAADGTLVEFRPGDRQVVDVLAARFADSPGRALFIDYGPARSEPGDTLQALRRHQKVAALDAPGTADLTARVDFQSLVSAARAAGLAAHGPVEQGAFLTGLGIEHRAAALISARADQRQLIARQLFRLTDDDQMGRLFKLVCVESQDLPVPAGF